jgi:hypothetical protein
VRSLGRFLRRKLLRQRYGAPLVGRTFSPEEWSRTVHSFLGDGVEDAGLAWGTFQVLGGEAEPRDGSPRRPRIGRPVDLLLDEPPPGCLFAADPRRIVTGWVARGLLSLGALVECLAVETGVPYDPFVAMRRALQRFGHSLTTTAAQWSEGLSQVSLALGRMAESLVRRG